MAHLVGRGACPVCAGSEHRTRLSVPYDDPALAAHLRSFYGGRAELDLLAGGTYVLRECAACGLLHQAEVPDAHLLERIYDHWIDPAASRRAASDRQPAVAAGYRRLLDDLARAVGRPPTGLRVLDLGMGWGGFAEVAREAGCDVAGVELSTSRREHAAARGLATVDPGAEADGSYDVVVALQVLEHVVAPVAELGAATRLLRPGGVAHVEVPDGSARRLAHALAAPDWAAPKGDPRSLNAVAPLEHLNAYGREALAALVAQVGLTAVDGPRPTGPRSLAAAVRRRLRPGPALGVTGARPLA